MRRREFIAGLGAAATWPAAARAQQDDRIRRIGVLTYGAEADPDGAPIRGLLRDELQRLGWTEGRNLRLDFRFGNGDADQTRVFAADLVRLAPDAIVAVYLLALRSLQQQTKTIPIIFTWAGDAVEIGTVINSARPEGNITGFANAFGSLGGKWLDLLKEAAPNITRVLYIYPADNLGSNHLHSVEAAARSLGVQVTAIPVSSAPASRRRSKPSPPSRMEACLGVPAYSPSRRSSNSLGWPHNTVCLRFMGLLPMRPMEG